MNVTSYIIKFITVLLALGMLSSCGGKTRQLTEEEKIWMPRDRERMRKVKAGRGLLTDFFFRRDDSEESNNESFATSKNYGQHRYKFFQIFL